jgi:hypothetical protein
MIAMLGDLKGVKYLIESSQFSILQHRITTINEIFVKAFLAEKNRSRSLECFSFSDSILAVWTSDYEGKDYYEDFCLSIWTSIKENGFPYRMFIDIGNSYPDNDNISRIISSSEGRFKKIFPVSIPIWSVFYAEGAKFPEGVFVGDKLMGDTNGLPYHEVPPFKYYKIA